MRRVGPGVVERVCGIELLGRYGALWTTTRNSKGANRVAAAVVERSRVVQVVELLHLQAAKEESVSAPASAQKHAEKERKNTQRT